MDLHDWRNVNRVISVLAREWNCPVWVAKAMIQRTIDDCWEKAIAPPLIKLAKNAIEQRRAA